ncbi:MAG: diaminopimelate epimerase [Gammaproteobacteria bacterium]|nr:diaminopimelate epimerase [Gammaproteobacteria bacterium]MDH3767540.1 diaminopimelate epimerase [Gammaproteobacteria bacterium]
MIVRFTKMHGAGNDFVVIDAMSPERHFDPDALGQSGRRHLADRHTGIGCDQLLVLNPPRHDNADVWIRIFNTDGSEAAQCGNGMRCIARYLSDNSPGKTDWRLDSDAGLMTAQIEADSSVSVDMGPPEWGADATGCTTRPPVTVDNETVDFALVSMGNPHAVITVDDANTAPVAVMGPALQHFFESGANVSFAQILGPSHLALRVWERGVGETLACGSGACAAVVAAQNAGMTDGAVAVDLPGGQLMVKWQGNGESVWLRGPAQRVFEGRFQL